ncbi:hypothetical protein UVI_02009150 [Ustilaginoidea virens]|uniref:Uncharacterized protein n=1 Tax=Ustilaginoidea virens TaxID=1159556 RepID=A0A1B5KUI8_USTVR|nr:hypothetical protein UVI_02009150 [Ustilaginoidea virens]
MSASNTEGTKSTKNTKRTKSTGPYDRAFQQHLIDHGIYPDLYQYPDGRATPQPENIEEIREVLRQPRPSLSPSRFSEDDFFHFRQAAAHVSKERQVTTTVIPIIEGNVGDRKCVAGQIPFTNLDPLTDGTLVPGNPDLYYGARPEQLDRKIRSELGGFIVPSTQHDLPVAPNFSLAVKGPDGSSAVAERQACYDGALQARGMQRLLSYGEPSPVYGNRAHAVTCTYLDGQIKMYTSHPVPSSNPRAKSEYVMTQINAYALTGNRDSFRQGVAAYRNARDWAKQQRDEAITQANNEVTDSTIATSASENNPALSFETDISVAETMTGDASQGASTPRNNAPSHDPDSDTSADDLSMDFVSKRAKIQSTTKESK